MAKAKTAVVEKTETKDAPVKKTTTKKVAPKTPAPAKEETKKIQETFSEVFESDVDSKIAAFLNANGVETYEIVSESKEEDNVTKTIEITL